MPLLEVCTPNLQSVVNAVAGGARRIELCAALPLDGLTPSLGLLKYVRECFPQLTIHVLIRSREGDFVYNNDELRVMAHDIRAMQPYADAFVGGALTPEGDIDQFATRLMVYAAGDRPFTFHRAFDHVRQPVVAMEQLISLGCARILTSGQQPTAQQGIPLLRQLTDLAGDRIIILPGGGVTPQNAPLILRETGATEIHASCTAGSAVTQTAIVQQLLSSINPA